MENRYKLEKEYNITVDIFREGYRAFQKKYIYPKKYVFMVIFLILSADFTYAAFKDPNNYFAYLLIVVCLAFAFKQWYNPRRIRRNLVETVQEMGEPVYKIGVGDGYIDISTVSAPDGVEEEPETEEESEDGEVWDSDLPEPTRIPADNDMVWLEYDQFFLMLYGKTVFYIIPKEKFDEKELDILRNINRR